jgi:hypothetical protein
MQWLRDQYAKLSDPLKAALATALFTFVTLFGASLAGFVQTVVDWASTGGDFPDPSVLGQAFISALTAAGVGLLNFVIRWLQANTNLIKGSGPSYSNTPSEPPSG